jgi:hypothetical protein
MFNKLFFSFLLFAAASTPSFTSIQTVEQTQVAVSGNSLTVTHPAAGTAAMNWQFSQPTEVYYVIIEDLVVEKTVRTASTTQTNYTATGLPPGYYRYTVSNGTDLVILQDLVLG